VTPQDNTTSLVATPEDRRYTAAKIISNGGAGVVNLAMAKLIRQV
jgi:hypothetical protein